MKKFGFILLAVLAMAACSSKAPKQVNVDELIVNLDKFDGQDVEFSGKAVFDSINGGIAVYGTDTVVFVYVLGAEDVAICPSICGKQVSVQGKVGKCEQGKMHVKASDIIVDGKSCKKECNKDQAACKKDSTAACCKKDSSATSAKTAEQPAAAETTAAVTKK